MKSALLRFFFVTTGIAILLLFGWLYLRSRGEQKAYTPLAHAFWRASETWTWVSYQGDQDFGPAHSWTALDSAAARGTHIVLWVDVHLTPKMELVIGQGDSATALSDFLNRYPDHRAILNILDYGPGSDSKIVQTIHETKSAHRIILQSPRDGPLKEIREKEAMWLYGTSQAQITQFLTLSSVALEALSPLRGDVYISPLRFGESEVITPRVLAEIHKRGKKTLIGPVSSQEDLKAVRALGVNGVITPYLSQLQNTAP